MDRRESLRALVIGSFGTGLLMNGCQPNETISEEVDQSKTGDGYGRTPEEVLHDKKVRSELPFFNDHERQVLTILADIIIPKEGDNPAASEVGTIDFIDFMMVDIPTYQDPMIGGIRWIDYESLKRFEASFDAITESQRMEIVEDIAYPFDASPMYQQGAKFFSLVRDLVGTGYFTSREGIADMGYIGNAPNVWNGAPQDVLDKHGFTYEDRWSDLYLKPEERGIIAKWDDDKNLIG